MSTACECGSTDLACRFCDFEIKNTYLISACRCQGRCKTEKKHSVVGVQDWSKDEVRIMFYRMVLTILETNGKVHKNGTLIKAFTLWGSDQNESNSMEWYMNWSMDYESDEIGYLDVVHDFLAVLFDPEERSILSKRKTKRFSHEIKYNDEYFWLDTNLLNARVNEYLHFHTVDTNEYS